MPGERRTDEVEEDGAVLAAVEAYAHTLARVAREQGHDLAHRVPRVWPLRVRHNSIVQVESRHSVECAFGRVALHSEPLPRGCLLTCGVTGKSAVSACDTIREEDAKSNARNLSDSGPALGAEMNSRPRRRECDEHNEAREPTVTETAELVPVCGQFRLAKYRTCC